MKTTGFRSFVLYILLFAFCGGFVWFLINLALNGSTWATQPYNGHIYGDDTAVSAGTITDRSGMVLAKTEDGSRVYAESEDIRRALLHTVGDSSGYIGTAVQACTARNSWAITPSRALRAPCFRTSATTSF